MWVRIRDTSLSFVLSVATDGILPQMVYGHSGSLFLKDWAESLKLFNAIRKLHD